jgi:hypothetical protein
MERERLVFHQARTRGVRENAILSLIVFSMVYQNASRSRSPSASS